MSEKSCKIILQWTCIHHCKNGRCTLNVCDCVSCCVEKTRAAEFNLLMLRSLIYGFSFSLTAGSHHTGYAFFADGVADAAVQWMSCRYGAHDGVPVVGYAADMLPRGRGYMRFRTAYGGYLR